MVLLHVLVWLVRYLGKMGRTHIDKLQLFGGVHCNYYLIDERRRVVYALNSEKVVVKGHTQFNIELAQRPKARSIERGPLLV